MTGPRLSVVIASVNGFPHLGECLDSLGRHAPGAEVVVADCTDEETRRRVTESWPWAKVIGFQRPMPIPALRAAGIAAATAPRVAVIEDHCVVTPRWEAALAGARASAAGGPIRNGARSRVRDWAGFLFEYSAFLEPVERAAERGLPGMNVSYDRRAIETMDDLLREGKWESWLHGRLRERGLRLEYEPEAVIEHHQEFGVRSFTAQRYHYARSYAAMRSPDLGHRRFLYALGAPLLVPLLYARVVSNVLRSNGHGRELVLATPLLLLYNGVTAVGEAVGYLFGGGGSLLKVR